MLPPASLAAHWRQIEIPNKGNNMYAFLGASLKYNIGWTIAEQEHFAQKEPGIVICNKQVNHSTENSSPDGILNQMDEPTRIGSVNLELGGLLPDSSYLS